MVFDKGDNPNISLVLILIKHLHTTSIIIFNKNHYKMLLLSIYCFSIYSDGLWVHMYQNPNPLFFFLGIGGIANTWSRMKNNFLPTLSNNGGTAIIPCLTKKPISFFHFSFPSFWWHPQYNICYWNPFLFSSFQGIGSIVNTPTSTKSHLCPSYYE